MIFAASIFGDFEFLHPWVLPLLLLLLPRHV